MSLRLLLQLSWLMAGTEAQQPGYRLQVQKKVTAQEGLCVLVPCSFSYPRDAYTDLYSAYGFWFTSGTQTQQGYPVATNDPDRTVQVRTRDRFQLVGDPRKEDCSLVIRDVQREDQNSYFFRLEAREGQLLRLLCSADGQPPATLSWVREDRVLSRSHPPGPRALALELPAVKAGDSGHYTCRAENGLGSQSSSLDLSVQYPPEDLRVAVSHANRTVLEVLGHGASLPVLEGQSLRLACVAHSNPPARLSWAWGAQSLSLGQPSDPGVLELPQVQLQHQGEFTCLARNPLGARNISLILSVHGKPELGSRFLPEAVLATAVVILLCLCLGLIFLLMKTLRKKAARLDAPSTLGPVCRVSEEPSVHQAPWSPSRDGMANSS